MPTYSYRCTQCGNEFDVRQSFSDDPLTACEVCGGTLRKLFNSVGIVFKGSGFYRNDARSSSDAGKAKAQADETNGTSSETSGRSDKAAGASGESGTTGGSRSSKEAANAGSSNAAPVSTPKNAGTTGTVGAKNSTSGAKKPGN